MTLRDIVNSLKRDFTNYLITLPGRHIPIEMGVEVDGSIIGKGIENHVLEVDGYREEIAVSYLLEDFDTVRKSIMDNANKDEGFKGILMPRHADFRPVEDISCLGRVIIEEFRYDIAGWVAKEFTSDVKSLEPMLSYAGAVFFPREGEYSEKMKSFFKIADRYPYLGVFNNENAIPKKMGVKPGGIEIAALKAAPIIPIGIHYDYLVNLNLPKNLAVSKVHVFLISLLSSMLITKVRIVFGKPIDPLGISDAPRRGYLLQEEGRPLIKGEGNLPLMLAQSAYILAKTHAFFYETIPVYITKRLKPELYFGK